jgi:hypothetical protein
MTFLKIWHDIVAYLQAYIILKVYIVHITYLKTWPF